MADIMSSAQTERRSDAGPVRGLLGGKDLTGRFLLLDCLPRAPREAAVA
jgi:hypothetical protein